MKKMSKIENQLEESITEKVCISEMVRMINRFIKGLESLNMGPSELLSILDMLRKTKRLRIEIIDRLIRFNGFADNLYVKLIKGYKICILNTAECIRNGKKS